MKRVLTLVLILTFCALLSANAAAELCHYVATRRPFPQWALRVGIAPVPAEITVSAGDNLQTKYNSAVCGDFLTLTAGDSWQTNTLEVPILVATKACPANNPLTIRGSNHGSLPTTFRDRTVEQLQALNLPKLISGTATPALELAGGESGHRFIGIEVLNDDRGIGLVNNGLIFAGVTHGSSPPVTYATVPRDNEFNRVWVHSEEDGTNSQYATCLRGFWLGAADMRILNSRVAGFSAFAPSTTNPQSTQAILIEKGPGPYIIDGNFLNAWFTSIFTGGGPQWILNEATVSSASSTQATLSNVSNLSIGDYIAFKVTGQSSPYQVARVTNIAGSVVTYVGQAGAPPANGNPLLVAPDTSPGHALWNGDRPTSVVISHNTFWKNPTVGATAGALGYFGKGHIEFKTIKDGLVEGNDFSGFSAGFTITSRNQPTEAMAGANPWATITNLTFRSNRWTATTAGGSGAVIGIQLNDDLATTVPGSGVTFENNLFENLGSPPLSIKASANVSFIHNTMLGGAVSAEWGMIFGSDSPSSGFLWRDNITQNNQYGQTCPLGTIPDCFPAQTFTKNVIVDNRQSPVGSLCASYPAGNFCPANQAAIVFNGDWSLNAASPYKGQGTGGADPGVNVATLTTALAGTGPPPIGGSPCVRTKGNVRLSGNISVRLTCP